MALQDKSGGELLVLSGALVRLPVRRHRNGKLRVALPWVAVVSGLAAAAKALLL